MDLIIIYLIASILLFIIIYKILKSILKTIIFLSIISILFFGILAFLIYADFKDIQTNLPTKPNLFLLEKENNLEAGLILKLSNLQKPYSPINNQNLKEYNADYTSKDLSTLKGENYKLLIIDYDSLISLIKFPIEEGQIVIDKQQIDKIFTSQDPYSELSQIFPQYTQQNIKTTLNINDESELKSIFFTILLQQIKDQTKLIPSYQQGKITLYPETILFKTLKYIPENIISNLNLS